MHERVDAWSDKASMEEEKSEKLTFGVDQSQLKLIWDLLTATLFDDAKLIAILKLLRSRRLGLSKIVEVETSRNTRRHIKASVIQCSAALQAEYGPTSPCGLGLFPPTVKKLATPVVRNQLRAEAASTRLGPAWSIRLLPVCYPTASTEGDAAPQSEQPYWCGALWVIATELNSRLVLVDIVSTSVVHHIPEGLSIPEKVLDQHDYPYFLHRVIKALHYWGGSVHFPLDGKDGEAPYYRKIESWLRTASPITPKPAIQWNLDAVPALDGSAETDVQPRPEGLGEALQVFWDMPCMFPEEDTPAIRLNRKPCPDGLSDFEAHWNGAGRESAPIGDFRDLIITKKINKNGKRKSKGELLKECYTTFLPFVGVQYLTDQTYFTDQRAEFWKLVRSGKLTPKIKRMPLGFAKETEDNNIPGDIGDPATDPMLEK